METPEGSLEYEASLSDDELAFVVEIGLNVLMAKGAMPFLAGKEMTNNLVVPEEVVVQ
jgi:hypothetical protein